MPDSRNTIALAGPGSMILSAIIFGFFGFFYIQWNPYSAINPGQYLWFVALCKWTLQIGAVVFAVAAGVTMVNRVAGNVIYAGAGLLSAIMFVVIALLDFADTQHTIAPYAALVLLLFAAWNGFASFTTLRDLWLLRENVAPAVGEQ